MTFLYIFVLLTIAAAQAPTQCSNTLVITEMYCNDPHTDPQNYSFIEIYNPSASVAVNLSEWEIVYDAQNYKLPSVLLAGNTYFTIGHSGNFFGLTPDMELEFDFIAGTGIYVALKGAFNNIPTILDCPVGMSTSINSTGGFECLYPSPTASLLDCDLCNGVTCPAPECQRAWCEEGLCVTNSLPDQTDCSSGYCYSGTCYAVSSTAHLIISEVDPVDDYGYGFIELYNPNAFDVDLNGYRIVTYDLDLTFDSKLMAPQEVLVISDQSGTSCLVGSAVSLAFGDVNVTNVTLYNSIGDQVDFVAWGEGEWLSPELYLPIYRLSYDLSSNSSLPSQWALSEYDYGSPCKAFDCSSDADCDDGIYCTGTDLCIASGCYTDAVCADGVVCDESTHSCYDAKSFDICFPSSSEPLDVTGDITVSWNSYNYFGTTRIEIYFNHYCGDNYTSYFWEKYYSDNTGSFTVTPSADMEGCLNNFELWSHEDYSTGAFYTSNFTLQSRPELNTSLDHVVIDEFGIPFNSLTQANRWQTAYSASDLGVFSTKFTLSNILIHIGQTPSFDFTTFSIRIGFSDSTNLNNTFVSTTEVFSINNALSSYFADDTWANITLTSSILWETSKALVIEIYHASESALSGGGSFVFDCDNCSVAAYSDDWTSYSDSNSAATTAFGVGLRVKIEGQSSNHEDCGSVEAQTPTTNYASHLLSNYEVDSDQCENSALPGCRYASLVLDYHVADGLSLSWLDADEGGKDRYVVFVHGGQVFTDNNEEYWNDLWVFKSWNSEKSDADMWWQLYASNNSDTSLPAGRCFHAGAIVGDSIWIHGGVASVSLENFFGDVWEYNIISDQWIEHTSLAVTGRNDISAVTDGFRYLYIFGGDAFGNNGTEGLEEMVVTNQMLRLDTIGKKWDILGPSEEGFISDLNRLDNGYCSVLEYGYSASIECLYGYAMVLYTPTNGTEAIYIFGGDGVIGMDGWYAPIYRITNALYKFDLETNTFSTVMPFDCKNYIYPAPRFSPVMSIRYSKAFDSLIIFGGSVTLPDPNGESCDATPIDYSNSNDLWEVPINALAKNTFARVFARNCSSEWRYGCYQEGGILQYGSSTLFFGGSNQQVGSVVYTNQLWLYAPDPAVRSVWGSSSLGYLEAINVPTDLVGVTITLEASADYFYSNALSSFLQSDECGDLAWETDGSGETALTCVPPAGIGKTILATIQVCNIKCLESNSLEMYSYSPPRVTSIDVGGSSTEGGYNVTITGNHFGFDQPQVITVKIGDTSCRHLYWISSSEMVCTVREGSGANLPYTVMVGDQQDQYLTETFSYAAPVITGLSSSSEWPTIGGNIITITGENFGPRTNTDLASAFGSLGCSSLQRVSHTEMTCVIPPGVGNNMEFFVTVSAQQSNNISVGYAAPIITSLSYPKAYISGGTLLTISGQNFGPNPETLSTKAPTAFIGIHECTKTNWISQTELECIVPEISEDDDATDLAVTVEIGGQVSAQNSHTDFSYEVDDSIDLEPYILVGMIVCVAYCIIILALIVVYRNTSHIKAASILFSVISVFGALVALSSIPFFDPDDDNCHLPIWLVAMGFTLLCGSIVLKNYRILRIFNSRDLSAHAFNDRELLIMLFGLLILDTFFLLIYTLITDCGDDIPTTGVFMLLILCTTKVVFLVFGVVVAYRSRVIYMERFQERQQLGIAIYNLAVLIVVFIPLRILLADYDDVSYAVTAIGIAFASVVSLGVLFFPKFFAIWFGPPTEGISKSSSKAFEMQTGGSSRLNSSAQRAQSGMSRQASQV